MANWPGHFLYSFRGHFGASASDEKDIWSCGLRVDASDNSFQNDTDKQELVNDAAADWLKFHTNTFSYIGNNVWFDYVRLYSIGSNGQAVGEIYQGEPQGGPAAGAYGGSLPFQCSVVLTLDTGRRTRPRFGRIFLPALGVVVGPTGRLTTTIRDEIATASQTLINDLNNLTGFDGPQRHTVSVVSSVGSGAIAPVERIRVGDVVDTMRSRRSGLRESYATRDVQ